MTDELDVWASVGIQQWPARTFTEVHSTLTADLLRTTPINIGEWQSLDVSGSKIHATYELVDVTVRYPVPESVEVLANEVKPNLPWADEHFSERVSRIPLNPPPSHVHWPWARHNTNHMPGGVFSHTYPERMWARYQTRMVNEPMKNEIPMENLMIRGGPYPDRTGVRYRYGDLQDVVNLLVRSPLTRQAFLPIWFPEDTGAHHGQRVPCTLGYHFMIRDSQLHCWYYIRSCDIIRHFADDVYLAGRLMQWVVQQWIKAVDKEPGRAPEYGQLQPGQLIMHISSLHAFAGDQKTLERMAWK